MLCTSIPIHILFTTASAPVIKHEPSSSCRRSKCFYHLVPFTHPRDTLCLCLNAALMVLQAYQLEYKLTTPIFMVEAGKAAKAAPPKRTFSPKSHTRCFGAFSLATHEFPFPSLCSLHWVGGTQGGPAAGSVNLALTTQYKWRLMLH